MGFRWIFELLWPHERAKCGTAFAFASVCINFAAIWSTSMTVVIVMLKMKGSWRWLR